MQEVEEGGVNDLGFLAGLHETSVSRGVEAAENNTKEKTLSCVGTTSGSVAIQSGYLKKGYLLIYQSNNTGHHGHHGVNPYPGTLKVDNKMDRGIE